MIAPFGPVPRDRVEADVVERIRRPPEPFQRRGPPKSRSSRRFGASLHPASTGTRPSPRRPADVPRGSPGFSAAFFTRLWQDDRDHRPIAPRPPHAFRIFRHRKRRRALVDPDHAGQAAQAFLQRSSKRPHLDLGAQMRAHLCRQAFRGVHEQHHPPVILKEGKAMQHRVLRHIIAPDVQTASKANPAG